MRCTLEHNEEGILGGSVLTCAYLLHLGSSINMCLFMEIHE